MPITDFETLLQKIEKAGPRFALLATSLSITIEALEKRLNKLRGKVAVQISDGQCPFVLSWDRSGDEWLIFYLDKEWINEPSAEWAELKTAPIEVKSQAVPILGLLLEEILSYYEKRTDQILKNQETLRQLSSALQTEVKEVSK